MLKFVFLLTIWTADSPVPQVYVEDHNLTGEDCAALVVAYHEADPTYSRGVPSCEIDHAQLPAVFMHEGAPVSLPPCPTEDSRNCYWDATERGNGRGKSFYDVDGTAYQFHP